MIGHSLLRQLACRLRISGDHARSDYTEGDILPWCPLVLWLDKIRSDWFVRRISPTIFVCDVVVRSDVYKIQQNFVVSILLFVNVCVFFLANSSVRISDALCEVPDSQWYMTRVSFILTAIYFNYIMCNVLYDLTNCISAPIISCA